jgi:hypothetical protein
MSNLSIYLFFEESNVFPEPEKGTIIEIINVAS